MRPSLRGFSPLWAFILSAFVALSTSPAFSQLSASDRLDEARAAAHLGIVGPTVPTLLPNLATASSILDNLLADQTISDEIRLKATRLRFKLLDRIGDTAEFDADFSSLSASDATLSNRDWERQKKLWTASHEGARHDWDAVRASLAALPDTLIVPGPMEADLHLLHCNAAIRSVSTRANGFRRMADVIVESEGWTVDAYELGADYGQEELLFTNEWGVFEEVLDTLEGSGTTNFTARRRWLDLAAPGRDPRQNDYPDCTAEQARALRKAFHAKSAIWTPDPQQLPGAVGGYRELYELDLKAQDYFRMHRRTEFQSYLDNLPAMIVGIPTELYDAYKTLWQAMCFGNGLRLNDIRKMESRIDQAVEVLPEQAAAILYFGRAVSRLRFMDPRGLEDSVRYLASNPTNPRLINVRFHTIDWVFKQTNQPEFPIPACLEILDASRETPVRLATGAILRARRAGLITGGEREESVHQAIVDGARALHHSEFRQDPGQAALRERLGPLLAECMYAREGEAARDQMLAEFNGPVHENSKLSAYLTSEELTAAAYLSPELLSSYDAFESFGSLIREDGEFVNAQTGLSAHTDAEVKAALDAVPDALETRKHLLAARALLEEVESRGQRALGASLEEWEWARARSAELMLGEKDTETEGIARLASLAAQYDGSRNLELDRLAGFCATIIDALGPANTMEAYHWGVKWLDTIDDEKLHEMENLVFLLARPMARAYFRPEVQAYLTDPESGSEVRELEGFYITSAMVRLGAELRKDKANKPEAREVFEEVKPLFADLLEDPSFDPESEILMRIEQWQISLWSWEVLANSTMQEGEPLLRKIIEAVRARLPTLTNSGRLHEYADLGIWAANALGDFDAAREFEQAKYP